MTVEDQRTLAEAILASLGWRRCRIVGCQGAWLATVGLQRAHEIAHGPDRTYEDDVAPDAEAGQP